MIALARSGNKLWCEKVTTKKVFHNKFYILNRAAIEKRNFGTIASSHPPFSDDPEQDNDQARVTAIKVFKGSLFPRNSGRCHDGSIYAFLLILGWLQHSLKVIIIIKPNLSLWSQCHER